MKFYLSSFELGNQTQKLLEMVPHGQIGYIPNAQDFTWADQVRVATRTIIDMNSLKESGLKPELIDLRNYFGKKSELKQKLEELGSVYISGGNVFVLRQAMKLSGMDKILEELKQTDFVYAGYSAAGCVLSPTLKYYDIVDKIDTPYPEQPEVIWEGLGFVDWAFMPHWDSDHPESADVEKEIARCKEHNVPYKAIRDGEVIIIP